MRLPSWPASIILSLLDEAQEHGSASAATQSLRLAERARMAIYNYRRRNLAGDDPRQSLVITVGESPEHQGIVSVQKLAAPELELLRQDKAAQ